MAQNVSAGPFAYVNYGYEATFGSAASGTRTFGHGNKISISRNNNMERIFGLGARNATATVAKQYEGSASVEFILSNGSFWRAVLGAVADGGAAPYTHTYTEADTLPSFSILTGTELGTNDEVTALLGCKANSMTLTTAVNELVKVTMDVIYKTETLATSGIGSQVAETEVPFTFAQGSVQLPSGSTIGNVQSFELTINNSADRVFGLGSRFLTSTTEKQREYNIRMTVAFSNVTDLLTKFYGASGAPLAGTPAAQATLVLTFTNGLTLGNERTFTITLANVYLNTETLPKDPTEIIKEDVEGWALSGTSVVYENGTEVDIGNP